MNQKYKFFIKGNAVIFRQTAEFQENKPQLTNYWIDRLKKMDLSEDTMVEVSDLRSFIDQVKFSLLFIKAGGGYVLNSQRELLMIYRRGFWDLPKGKLDRGEKFKKCAVREVEEETSVTVRLGKKVCTTWHTYTLRRKRIMKKTKWYAMTCIDDEHMAPQHGESIEDVRWMTDDQVKKVVKESYKSVRFVIKKHKELMKKSS